MRFNQRTSFLSSPRSWTSPPHILRVTLVAGLGRERRGGGQAGECVAKHRGSKHQDPIQKENPGSTGLMGFVDTHNDYAPVGEAERLEDEQKTLERKAVKRIQKENLKAMYKMFRVLMVQSQLEESTASP